MENKVDKNRAGNSGKSLRKKARKSWCRRRGKTLGRREGIRRKGTRGEESHRL